MMKGLYARLEEAEKFFNENYEFIYKTIQFQLSFKDNADKVINPIHVFQSFFLQLLMTPFEDSNTDNIKEKLSSLSSQMPTCEDTDHLITEQHFFDLSCPDTFEQVPQKIRKHILHCEKCSERLFNFMNLFNTPLEEGVSLDIRFMVAQLVEHFSHLEREVDCKDCNKFLPLLADETLSFKIPTPITIHIENCPQCTKDFEDIQKLGLKREQLRALSNHFQEQTPINIGSLLSHTDVIAYIKKRGNSGIRTYCQLADLDEEQQELSDPPDLNFDLKNEDYLQWGLKAKKIGNRHHTAKKLKITQHKGNIYKLKPLLKPVAAAAVILIGISLFFVASPAKAVTLEQIYKSIASIRNICITSYVAGKDKPIQAQYISLDENVIILETSNKTVFFNLNKKTRTIKNIVDSSITQTTLSEKMCSKASKRMENNFGLLPFDEIVDLPENAIWNQVDNEIESISDHDEIYDLTWSESDNSSQIFRRWRVYVDTHTHLPHKVAWYLKFEADSDYKFEKYSTVKYPSKDEIKTKIDSITKY